MSRRSVNAVYNEMTAEESTEKPPPPADERKKKPGMQTVDVPEDFIIYRCKIGNGRVIEIPLPKDFTTKDADRLHAFLKTQVDDDPAQKP